ncbi:hypothetical protein TNCV_1382801 [Trichonephila clavipes]|nr:hypothetical protein TNCV_1382801 [Trichonephila clavipes]
MQKDNVVKKLLQYKVTGSRKRGRQRVRPARLNGIRHWDYKRENLENEGEWAVTMEETSMVQDMILPDMMMM